MSRAKKSRKRYILPIREKTPSEQIFIKFCTSGDMSDVIICANFGVKKSKEFGIYGGGSDFGFFH